MVGDPHQIPCQLNHKFLWQQIFNIVSCVTGKQVYAEEHSQDVVSYLKKPPRTLHATFLATQRTGIGKFACVS
jgi:hypothetical protein